MKRASILIVLTCILSGSLYSQEKTTSKEVGLYFSSLDAFGIRYRFGNEKHMFRLTALSLSASSRTNNNGSGITNEHSDAGIGLNFGIELPVTITDKLNFYYGGELSGSYSHSTSNVTYGDETITNSYNAGIGIVLGFAYSIKSNIILSAEIVPGLQYFNSKSNENTTSGIGFGLHTNSAGLTIGYRF